MKQWFCGGAFCCAAVVAQAGPPDARYEPENTQAGNVLQFGLPLLGLGLTWLLESGEGSAAALQRNEAGALADAFDWNRLNGSPRHDFALAFGRMELVTYGLKFAVDEQRPNEGGGMSFPSGHTAASFMGAEFIRKQYGWQYGAPAYVAASFVGWTRVASRAHHPHDVWAGAVIGILSNHDLSDLKLPWGELSIGVSVIAPPAANDGFAAFGPADTTLRGWTPGLQARLSFR